VKGFLRNIVARAKGESGVSLIELLIAISITTIIMAPIASSIFVGLRTTGATQNRVQESVGANLLSSYLTPDVQNAVTAATNTTEVAGTCPAPLQNVALLLTTQPGISSISYYQGTGANARVLYRRVCTSGAVSSTSAISRSLAPTTGVSFACTPAPCGTNWQSVAATLSQQVAPFDTSPYVATVTAARRVG
jgi:Tfp pilus assembly protein PilV